MAERDGGMFDRARERGRERGLSKGGETAVERKRKGKRGNWKGEGVGACARISHVSPRIRERLTSGARRPGGSVSCAISYAALPNFRPCRASTDARSFRSYETIRVYEITKTQYICIYVRRIEGSGRNVRIDLSVNHERGTRREARLPTFLPRTSFRRTVVSNTVVHSLKRIRISRTIN